MRSVLLLAAAAFVVGAAPSEASCLDALQWRGQTYVRDGDATARAGATLTDQATIPRCSDTVVIHVGETKARPKPYAPPRREFVSTVVGVAPTVAVLRDGKVYRSLDPLAALPWTYRLTAVPEAAAR